MIRRTASMTSTVCLYDNNQTVVVNGLFGFFSLNRPHVFNHEIKQRPALPVSSKVLKVGQAVEKHRELLVNERRVDVRVRSGPSLNDADSRRIPDDSSLTLRIIRNRGELFERSFQVIRDLLGDDFGSREVR